MFASMLLACAVASAGAVPVPEFAGGQSAGVLHASPDRGSGHANRADLRAPVLGPMPGPHRRMVIRPGSTAPAPGDSHALRPAFEVGHDLLRGRPRHGSPGIEPGTLVASRDRGGTAPAGPAVHPPPAAASSDVHPAAGGQPYPRAETVGDSPLAAGTMTSRSSPSRAVDWCLHDTAWTRGPGTCCSGLFAHGGSAVEWMRAEVQYPERAWGRCSGLFLRRRRRGRLGRGRAASSRARGIIFSGPVYLHFSGLYTGSAVAAAGRGDRTDQMLMCRRAACCRTAVF